MIFTIITLQTFIHELGGSILESLSVFFLAVLFLQSGFDKLVDRAGNLSWLKDHFSKSPLSGMVSFLLSVVTLVEVIAGLASLIGAGWLVFNGDSTFAIIGTIFSMLALVMLFAGQRIAKDYAGAQSLVSYFILTIITLLMLLDKI